MFVRICAKHNQRTSAAGACDLQGHDSDRAWPLDYDDIARFDTRFFYQRVIGDANRLGQGSIFERHISGDVMKNVWTSGHIAGKGAIDQRAVPFTVGAKVVAAAQTIGTSATNLRRRLTDDTVARAKPADPRAYVGHNSAKLMAEY